MSTKSLQISQIEECLGVVYTAVCDQCGVDQSDNTDETAFAAKLYDLGWRRNDNGVLFCPTCAPKVK
jgi:hypothetical protein